MSFKNLFPYAFQGIIDHLFVGLSNKSTPLSTKNFFECQKKRSSVGKSVVFYAEYRTTFINCPKYTPEKLSNVKITIVVFRMHNSDRKIYTIKIIEFNIGEFIFPITKFDRKIHY